MSLHDEYSRRTPFELTFPDPAVGDDLVARLDEEAKGRGSDPTDPHSFVTMGTVGDFIRDLQGPDAPPGAVHQFGALLFHCTHFKRAGHPLFLLSTHVARYLVEGVPDGEPEPVARAGYLQLPQHLFWAEGHAETPESVDGFFWTLSGGALHSMIVTGLHAERPGLGVVALPEAPLAEVGAWLTAEAREHPPDFAASIPGGELDGLYSFRTAGEVLKLLARFFAYGESNPAAFASVAPVEREGTPMPSRLRFTRVTLHA